MNGFFNRYKADFNCNTFVILVKQRNFKPCTSVP